MYTFKHDFITTPNCTHTHLNLCEYVCNWICENGFACRMNPHSTPKFVFVLLPVPWGFGTLRIIASYAQTTKTIPHHLPFEIPITLLPRVLIQTIEKIHSCPMDKSPHKCVAFRHQSFCINNHTRRLLPYLSVLHCSRPNSA